MGHEIELKLAMSPKALARLRRHPLIRSLAGGRRARRLELTATYYDTPDRRLAARGIALRIRSDGKHVVQTLKAPMNDGRGLQSLAEYEATLPDGRLDTTLITDEALADFLAEPGVGDALAPIFETRILRHVLPVRLLDSDVEIAFDQGEVVAGDRSEAICEAEFELKDGHAGALYQLALSAIEHVPFRIEPRSKSARGYSLADGAKPAGPATAQPLAIDTAASIGEAFAAVVRNCLSQVRSNEAAITAGCEEPEAVHQLRVAVRRLRAALAVFRPCIAEPCFDYLAGELKWLQNGLGPARDWDVFAMETLAPMHRRLAAEPGLDDLAGQVEPYRSAGRQAARDMLALPRYTVFLLRIEQWLEDGGWATAGAPGRPAVNQPAERLLRKRLAKRARQVLTSGRERDEDDAESLHRLRIACKKLRYALEFAASLLAKGDVKPALKGLKSLQECLGSLNDAAVTRRLLDEAASAGQGRPDARAAGLVTGWQANRIETDLGHLRRAWKRARKAIRALR